MKNKIKYLLIPFFLTAIILGVVFFGLVPYLKVKEKNNLENHLQNTNIDSLHTYLNKCKLESKNNKKSVDIYRWDLKVFKSKLGNNKDKLIQQIMQETQSILPNYTKEDYERIMQDGDWEIISNATYNLFGDRLPYIDEINEGFCAYKNLFPDKKEVKIIVYLDDDIKAAWAPGYNPVFFPINYFPNSDFDWDWVTIGLHWFLGSDHALYATENIPTYINSRYDSIYISPMLFHQLGTYLVWEGGDIAPPSTFLDFMIRDAKPYFFAKHILSDVLDYRIFGNSSEDILFFKEKEKTFWKDEILTNQLLYSKDRDRWRESYIQPGDYLVTVDGAQFPSRFGVWIGLQILNAYFQSNDVSLQEVLFEKDYKKILNQSNYQP